jgi:predicted nucleic acid-binding protein
VIVVECSAMVDALVGSPANPKLLDIIATGDLHSPTLLDYEVASALRGHLRGGLLTTTALDIAMQDYTELHIERYELTGLLRDIMALRDSFTAYDAAYIVLAQALDAPLVTVDDKLREAERLGVDVRVCR